MFSVLIAAATLAAADGPRAPTGKWVVNFAATHCTASREYGSADKSLTLVLKAPVQGEVLQLAVLRAAKGTPPPMQVEGRVGVGSSAKPASALIYSSEKGLRRVHLFNLPRTEVVAWGDGGELAIKAGNGLDEKLQVAELQPLMKVMGECVADLAQHWNHSGQGEAPKVRQEPETSLPGIFSSDDYPRDAIYQGQEGTVGVVLLVDERGKVADCTLVATSGIASLDAQTCVIIQHRARYKPAVGLDGKPAKGVDTARIRWVVP